MTFESNNAVRPPLYYRVVIAILKPLYRLQVWRRSRHNDNYAQEVAQRFGHVYPPRPKSSVATESPYSKGIERSDRVVWCHAVSLGETNTVAPLLTKLLAQGYGIWLTNTTQTGFARGARLFADDIHAGRLSHTYVPVDSVPVIKAFLAEVRPSAALFVETELWANTLAVLSEQQIPSILVNGRLSEASFRRYQKIAAVSASMMENLTLLIAQDGESAKRFRQLGAPSVKIRVAGSLKWVIHQPSSKPATKQSSLDARAPKVPSLARATDCEGEQGDCRASTEERPQSILAPDEPTSLESPITANTEAWSRPIWVAASTHNGEEAAALALHDSLRALPALSDALLIIVPRHPERFDEVAELINDQGLSFVRRSTQAPLTPQTEVFLADSMGEMMSWYRLADVALVGGSLVDVGGHNPVEPASVGTPVLIGRHTQSCQDVVDKLASVGALYQPHNDHYQPLERDPATDDTVVDTGRQQDSDGGHTKAVSGDTHAPICRASNLSKLADLDEDHELIYRQLERWLIDPKSARRAGHAGQALTAQQQAVLTRQFDLIMDVLTPAEG